MQRLFSTFPDGLPGAGLILLRTAVAVPLTQQAIGGALTGASLSPLAFIAAGAALFVLIGLWTPLAGALVAIIELALAVSHRAEPWTAVHFGTLSAAVAFLGPGAWSVDAHLFGRKHIEIPPRQLT